MGVPAHHQYKSSCQSYQACNWYEDDAEDDAMDDAKNVFTQEAEAPILGVALTASLPNLLKIALQVSEPCFFNQIQTYFLTMELFGRHTSINIATGKTSPAITSLAISTSLTFITS